LTDKACSTCHLITAGNICPKCKTATLSDDFSGLIIVFKAQDSALAKSLKITEKGRYAIKVR